MDLFTTEKAILVGVELSQDQQTIPLAESMVELVRLAHTAGAQIIGQLTQKRDRPDQKFYLGSGKVEELHALVHSTDANLVIFDTELSPAQERNLEEAIGVKVIDRAGLIIDIFAQHANSREGALQVELAQSNYLITRLVGHGVSMSRLGGGIGTRGPGETKLESDRRRIRKRIAELKREIDKVRQERSLRREKRKKSNIKCAALVGYTNSGKSTLLNALTKAQVLVKDQLFATLDPTTRRLYFKNGQAILLTDTVGFIQKLPHQLVAAFRATLEEVTEADTLIHIVDASHPYFEDQINAVLLVLEELGCQTKKILTVFNKTDKLKDKVSADLLKRYSPAVAICALNQEGFEQLNKALLKFCG